MENKKLNLILFFVEQNVCFFFAQVDYVEKTEMITKVYEY